LKHLHNLWNRDTAQFLVLFGRCCIGKTALIIEWIRRSGNPALYWVGSPTSAAAQRATFLIQLPQPLSILHIHPGGRLFEEIPVLAQGHRRRRHGFRMKPWQKEMWYIARISAGYVACMEDFLDPYAGHYDPQNPLACFDEGLKQLIEEVCVPIPM
jgi:hypothetical protein